LPKTVSEPSRNNAEGRRSNPSVESNPPVRDHETVESLSQVPQVNEAALDQSREFEIRPTNGVYIDGKRGSGKTELTKFLIDTLPYHFIVLDVVGNLKQYADKKKYPNIDYYLINPHDATVVEPLFEKILENAHRYSIWADQHGIADEDKNFGMLVLDEADRYDYYTGVKNTLNDIINLARNYGLGYIACSRRTAAVAKDILANADWLFIFRNVFKRDQKILAEWIDVDPLTLRDLDEHEFLIVFHGEAIGRSKLEL
jgi:hypothetical protein